MSVHLNSQVYPHGDPAHAVVTYILPMGGRSEIAFDQMQLSNFPPNSNNTLFTPPWSSQNQLLSPTYSVPMHQSPNPHPQIQTQQNVVKPVSGHSPRRQFTSPSVYSPQVGQFASPVLPSPQRNFSIPPMPAAQNMQYRPGLASPHSNFVLTPVTLSLQSSPSMLQSVQSPAGLPQHNGPPSLNMSQSTVFSPPVLVTSPVTYTVSPGSATLSTGKYSPNSCGQYAPSGQNVIVVPSPLLGAFASPDANYVTPSPSTNPGTPFVPVSQIDDVLKKARMPHHVDYPAGMYAPNPNQLSTGSGSSLVRRDSNSSSLGGPVLLGRYGSLSRHRVNSAELQPYHSAGPPAQISTSSPHGSVQMNYPLPFAQPSVGTVDAVGTEAADNDVSKLLEAFSFAPASFAGDERGSDILTKGYTFEDTVAPVGFDTMPHASQWQPLGLPSHHHRQVSPSAGGFQQPLIIQTIPPGADTSPSGHLKGASHYSAPSPITIITTTEPPTDKAYVSAPRERVQRLSPNSPNMRGFTQLPVAPQPPPTIIRAGGTKYYQCSWAECGKTFTRPYNLKSHYLSHTGEKPFLCDLCHLSFSRKHDLKRHFKLHQGLKPFQCPSCFKSFARSDALRRHLKTTDPDKVSMCALRIGVMTMQQDDLEAMDPVGGLYGIDDGALDSIVGVVSVGNEEGRYE